MTFGVTLIAPAGPRSAATEEDTDMAGTTAVPAERAVRLASPAVLTLQPVPGGTELLFAGEVVGPAEPHSPMQSSRSGASGSRPSRTAASRSSPMDRVPAPT